MNPYIGRVNQQLLFARHHLSLLEVGKNASQKMRNDSLLQSSLFHLRIGLDCYYRELASNYQAKNCDHINSIDTLSSELLMIGKQPGELEELRHLFDHGWIKQVMDAYARVWSSDKVAKGGATGVKPVTNTGGLSLVNLDAEPRALTFELVNTWISDFKEVIDRHRDVMQEY